MSPQQLVALHNNNSAYRFSNAQIHQRVNVNGNLSEKELNTLTDEKLSDARSFLPVDRGLGFSFSLMTVIFQPYLQTLFNHLLPAQTTAYFFSFLFIPCLAAISRLCYFYDRHQQRNTLCTEKGIHLPLPLRIKNTLWEAIKSIFVILPCAAVAALTISMPSQPSFLLQISIVLLASLWLLSIEYFADELPGWTLQRVSLEADIDLGRLQLPSQQPAQDVVASPGNEPALAHSPSPQLSPA